MKQIKKYLLPTFLFLLTLLTTTLAGSEWIHGRMFFINDTNIGWSEWMNTEKFLKGLAFSIPFLTFLTVHEFGHYLTARWYKVKVSLPFYIPLWLGITSTLGTIGAFIQIKSALKSRQQFFDIGIAGPLAGFVVALGVLWYGFTHLPPPEYIFEIHPEWEKYGLQYPNFVYQDTQGFNIALGKNLLFLFFENWIADPVRLPNAYEVMHYPLLFAGYMGLLFTALNLIPVGQLDGGHILYGLIGYKNHKKVAPVLFTGFVFYAGLGMISPYNSFYDLSISVPIYIIFLYLIFSKTLQAPRQIILLSMGVFTAQFVLALIFPTLEGYNGWFAFALLIGRFLGVYHPPALENQPLNIPRQILGWLALLIFILSFSPKPFLFS